MGWQPSAGSTSFCASSIHPPDGWSSGRWHIRPMPDFFSVVWLFRIFASTSAQRQKKMAEIKWSGIFYFCSVSPNPWYGHGARGTKKLGSQKIMIQFFGSFQQQKRSAARSFSSFFSNWLTNKLTINGLVSLEMVIGLRGPGVRRRNIVAVNPLWIIGLAHYVAADAAPLVVIRNLRNIPAGMISAMCWQ